MLLSINLYFPECTFIIVDKQRWADPGLDEEQCMVGDVNIFLTDPAEPSLAELEVMIAGGTLFKATPRPCDHPWRLMLRNCCCC